MPKVVTPRQQELYWQKRRKGFTMAQAAREAQVGYATVRRWEQKRNASSKFRVPHDERKAAGPIGLDELKPEAARALQDFGYFQRRYFGRIATPWQVEAAQIVVDLLATPNKEYLVINAPPGSGKSTTFTLDIPCWITVRNRAIRGQIGSNVESSATRYTQRIKRALERTIPIQGEAEQVAKGLALDAEATLADDFGTFRPEERDLWSAQAFVVAQHGNIMIDEKEPTWSAFGFDSGYLGMRYDFIVWDDLVDKKSLRTADAREKLQENWDDIAEKRLDPAGLLILQGQRMGADDLYRYALDKRSMPDDDDGEDETVQGVAKYSHVVFKAHYEDRCEKKHRQDAPYYPEGCLLDPRRLPWRELRAEMSNPRHNFAVIYQQEDTDPESVLVDPLWIRGGTDPKTGVTFPGCQDPDRDICELPHGLHGTILSIATADPSPTQFWSVQWWAVRCVDGMAQERYLLDLVRQRMDAPSFLDWNEPTRSFVGLMEEWQQRSVDIGLPISTWIVEKNGAQRFMLQYEHMRRWLAHWRTDLVPHETERNKADPEYGVQTLAGIFKYGLVRLPWKNHSRGYLASAKLVEEATHYPGWRTDDCVMAQWFLEWRLPHLIPTAGSLPRMERPSWLKKADTYSWREMWRKKISA